MKLKKLEIYGFKSFLDRTEIIFDDGITAIVGPNGCGKSNIADAMRWVLGEQSAKSLRGSVMQDIIFNGTENKKSMSYAEVSLYFDNKDKSLPLEYDDVIITRKLYRSGESEYYLNKNVCRLKDITELMRIGQVGREGYSIIGQGRVEQFINLKPEERRDIFDEATGIAACKAKKVESERKLSRTKDNLIRYKDILLEIERQLEPMQNQARQARKYLDCKEKLKYHEVNSFIFKTEQVESEKTKMNEKIKGISEELAHKRDNGQALEEKYQNSLNEISKADEHINTLRDRQLELMIAKERSEKANDLSNQRVDMLVAQNKSLKEEISLLEGKIIDYEKSIKEITVNIITSEKDYQTCLGQLKEINDNLSKTNEQVNLLAKELENARNDYAEYIKKSTILNNNLISLEKSKEYLLSALTENYNEKESGEDVINEIDQKINLLSNEKTELLSLLANKTDSLHKKEDEIKINSDNISKVILEINEFDKKKAGIISQSNFLKKMKDSYEGFSTSVKRLLLDSKNDSNLSSRIEGIVANLMTVPKNLEIAIESSLGNSIQNIVTKDVDDVKYLINYLKEKKYGIVTFLPIPFVKPRVLTKENETCLSMEGVLGVASKLVNYNPKYNSVFASLLGATVIVDNIDNGIKVAKKYNSSFKIVTLEGEILSTGGSISGGSYKPQISNVLSYDREINELKDIEDKINNAITSHNVNKTKFIISEQSLNSDIKVLSNEIKDIEIKIATLNENVNSLKSTFSTNKSAAEIRAEKAASLNSQLSQIEDEIKEIKSSLSEIKKYSASEDKIGEILVKYNSLSLEQKEVSDKAQRDKIKEVQLASDISKFYNNKSALSNEVESMKTQISNKKQGILNNEYIIERCKSELVDVDAISKEEIDSIAVKLRDVDNFKKEQNANLKIIDNDRTNSITEIQKLENKVVNLEFERDKIDSDLEVLRQKLSDEYNLDYESAKAYKDNDYKLSSANGEIKKLKDAIYSLGSVNVNAIEELAVLSERYDGMNKQKEDMENAEKDLNKVISELSDEMRVKFDDGFKKVNEYFQETFKELFGGGNAKLKLVDSENENKLDYGVDIEAQPPGKALQNINLLSGGEKALTAIAIIISIMKLRPMPFCIFDEIESALDEVNTVRFANYVKNFNGSTQFILVTHKKKTMEISDRMFGVTMQEKGISTVVSVKLSDAMEFKGVA